MRSWLWLACEAKRLKLSTVDFPLDDVLRSLVHRGFMHGRNVCQEEYVKALISNSVMVYNYNGCIGVDQLLFIRRSLHTC